jgi:murein DD-endopeptidase MepM/ murein hydrolase activator NlpD
MRTPGIYSSTALAAALCLLCAAGSRASVHKKNAAVRQPVSRHSSGQPRQSLNSGAIGDSLWAGMISRGVPPQVIMSVASIMEGQIDFLTEVRSGDRFAVVWHREAGAGRTVCVVDAFAYEGSETGRETAFRFEGGYYDSTARSLKRKFLRAPLSFAQITSSFSNNRYHPVLKIYRPHHGTDYRAAVGTPVSVVGDGLVTFTGWRGGLGRYVEVRHDSVYTTGYGHLSRFGKGVRKGAHVRQGQIIAYSGATGLVSGPHLHFQITEKGKYINFATMKSKTESGKLDRAKRKEFMTATMPLLHKLRMGLAGKQGIIEEPRLLS